MAAWTRIDSRHSQWVEQKIFAGVPENKRSQR